MHNVSKHLSRSIVQHSEFWDALRAILPGPKWPGESAKERLGSLIVGFSSILADGSKVSRSAVGSTRWRWHDYV